jgi:hypothetical protein
MAETLLYSRGMSLQALEEGHVKNFLPHISEENIEELRRIYGLSPEVAFAMILEWEGQYAVVRGGEVLAITGISEDGVPGEGIMWAMFSSKMKRNFVRFARASIDLIDFYQEHFLVINCNVWMQNHSMIQWLTFLEFCPEYEFVKNGETMISLSRTCVNPNIELVTKSRPVIH